MTTYLLPYLFVCFTVGLACLGVTLMLMLQRRSALVRAYFAFYLALSVAVLASLLVSFVEVLPEPVTPGIWAVLGYLEGIVGFYGVLFTFPVFAHRVYGVDDARRDRVVLAVTAVAVLAQHATEYGFGGRWDERGDLAENLVFVAISGYVLALGLARVRSPGATQPLARRVLALHLLGIPGLLHDLFWLERTSLRLYPLWYAALSLVITWTLYRSGRPSARGALPPDWQLSGRETEVARLVVQGLSNKEIAVALGISSHTVKSHLRAVFEKSGCRSRFALMSAVNGG